jgi:hypothetical protein
MSTFVQNLWGIMNDIKISTINTGYFKLDGGAMFGIVPAILTLEKAK